MTLSFLASCNTDQLCYDHPHDTDLNIKVDWHNAEDARCSSVKVWMYNSDGTAGTPYEVPREGGHIKVKKGEYDILAHNNDTEWILYSGQDAYHTHGISTRDANILEPMIQGFSLRGDLDNEAELLPNPAERVAATPEPVYRATVEKISLDDGDEITLEMEPLHCDYTFEFRHTGSLKNVASMSAAISGMAESVAIHSGEKSENTVTMPLSAFLGYDDDSIIGEFQTFGHNENVDTPHLMALYIVMMSGKQFKYVGEDYLDVTSQIENAPDPRHVHIVIEGAVIPDDETPSNTDVDWDISLEDWENKNQNIEM